MEENSRKYKDVLHPVALTTGESQQGRQNSSNETPKEIL